MKLLHPFVLNLTDLLYEITKVTFNELSDEAIHYYIDNYKPYDKAGLATWEWIGFIAVSKSKVLRQCNGDAC
jgi:predicted house-cleaning NTP pyrophosphatase (Maf/HAM1 superfamily)